MEHRIELVHVAANVYRLQGAPKCVENASALFAGGLVKRGNGSFTLTTGSGRTRTFRHEKEIERAALRELREWAFECPVSVNGVAA